MEPKTKYLLTCIQKKITRKGFSCPSCGQDSSQIVAKKYLVTALCRCKNCQLLFRTPTTTSEENLSFYQVEYNQGFTTDCPSSDVLNKYLEQKFINTEKDYSAYINIVRKAGGLQGNRLFDFGCSWGYGSWQFMQHGFDVESFEISVPRANFARSQLGVKVHSSLSDVKGLFDIFFSSHVLEHVPSVQESIEFGMSILKPGGLFVAITPNGSMEFRRKNGKAWDKLWGIVHPNFLDDIYYKATFAEHNFLLASRPYPMQEIESWNLGPAKNETILQLEGDELLLLARK